MPGRPKKPSQLKVLQGTDRKDRDNPLEPSHDHIEDMQPPEHLEGSGLECWNRVFPILQKSRVMTVADVEQFIHYCQLHGRIVDDYYKKKQMAPVNALAQIRMYSAMFGLDPSSRSKIMVPKPKEKKNKFNKLKKKQA